MEPQTPFIICSYGMNGSKVLVTRRSFMKGVSAASASVLLHRVGLDSFAADANAASPAQAVPAIDTHVHFYDPARPQGVPWPPKNIEVLYSPHMPAQFGKLTEPLNVVGAVVVEASPWVEDNQWVLDLAKDNPIIVGFIGNLELGKPEFAAQLKRFAANPLFRGLRLRGVTIPNGAGESAFADDLRRMADLQLTLDVVGGVPILADVLRIVKMAPDLRVVIDHLPFDEWHKDNVDKLRAALKEIVQLPKVYVKISHVPRRIEGRLVEDAAFYRPCLDAIWELFGPDRAIYGSDWPVCNLAAPYPAMHKIIANYFATRAKAEAEKFFWRNSMAAYSWVARGKAARVAKGDS